MNSWRYARRLSMRGDAIDHPPGEQVTESTVVGPFYVDAPPELPLGADITDYQLRAAPADG